MNVENAGGPHPTGAECLGCARTVTPSGKSCRRFSFFTFFFFLISSWLQQVPGLLSTAGSVAGQFSPCSEHLMQVVVSGGCEGDTELPAPAAERFGQHRTKTGNSSKSSILLAFRVGRGKLSLKLSRQ